MNDDEVKNAAFDMVAELKEERSAEQRPYISQWWVMDETYRPMLRIVAGPFNDEQKAFWEMNNRPGRCVVETRQSIYQPGEE